MADRWSEWEQTFRALACAREAHDDCPHLFGIRISGAFNPRVLHLGLGATMCRCSCHSTCPVAPGGKQMTVPWKVWWASCTCPGADQARRRMEDAGVEFADPGELWEKAKRDSAARNEAFRSARDRAAGRSRDEVREIYLAELRSRGLPMPSFDVVDATVDLIMGNPYPLLVGWAKA